MKAILSTAAILVSFLLLLGTAQAYTYHDPIDINSNAGFTAANGVTDGDGTSGDPYIIEDWTIYDSSSSSYGIRIRNTSSYFIVKNVFVYTFEYGLYLYNIDPGTAVIENSIFWLNQRNVEIQYSEDVLIDGVTAQNGSAYGIHAEHSSGLTVTDSNINYNYWGIYIEGYQNDGVTLEYSTFNSNEAYGVVGRSDGILIDHCEISYNDDALQPAAMYGHWDDAVVRHSDFVENSGYAIQTFGDYGQYYGNNFIGNNGGNTQARDEAGWNYWGRIWTYCYLGYWYFLGNYWDDHNCQNPYGACTNQNCLNYYYLDGNGNERDYHPVRYEF